MGRDFRDWKQAEGDRLYDLRAVAQGFPAPDLRIRELKPPSIVPRRRAPRLTERQIDALVEAYKAGFSLPEVAKHFQIHRTTALIHLQRNGVPRRPSVTKLTDEDVERAVQLYEQGSSTATIGREFEVHAQTIANALKREGIELRQPGRHRDIISHVTRTSLTSAVVRPAQPHR